MNCDRPNHQCGTRPRTEYRAVYQGIASTDLIPNLYSLDVNCDALHAVREAGVARFSNDLHWPKRSSHSLIVSSVFCGHSTDEWFREITEGAQRRVSPTLKPMSECDCVRSYPDHSHAKYNKESHCIVRRVLLSPSTSEKKPNHHWIRLNCKNQVFRCTSSNTGGSHRVCERKRKRCRLGSNIRRTAKSVLSRRPSNIKDRNIQARVEPLTHSIRFVLTEASSGVQNANEKDEQSFRSFG